MPVASNRQASLDTRRIDLKGEIVIRVPRFDSFVTEYSANISTVGMFIVSTSPQPLGAVFAFEFSVSDDWRLIRGTAQVVWIRYREEGPDRPPGMGVKFLDLDQESRRLIRWIVENHVRHGGTPFDVDTLRTEADKALVEVLADADREDAQAPRRAAPGRDLAPPESGRGAERKTGSGRTVAGKIPVVLTGVGIFAAGVTLFWLTERIPESDAGAAPASTRRGVVTTQENRSPSSSGPAEAASVSDLGRPGMSPDLPDEPPASSVYPTSLEAVTTWSDAWARQDVAAYLALYSEDFAPAGNLSRSRWEEDRRLQILKPSFITTSISGFDLERLDEGRVLVRFTLNVRTDRSNDLVGKELELAWEAGGWKIVGESDFRPGRPLQ